VTTVSRWGLFAIFASLLTAATINLHAAQDTKEAADAPAQQGSDVIKQAEEETPEDELAPAAVEFDVSTLSPLMQVLYRATRETKEDQILARITEAKSLIANGANIKAVDPRGRTALHWTVFGSSSSVSPKTLVGYEEIADSLIQKGVDINKEDMYQDTALDYLLYSPSFELQTLLIEHGATSGFLAAFYHFFRAEGACLPNNEKEAISIAMKADLAPGQTMSVRLLNPVYSDRSRTGDPFEAVVTYPLCRSGENIRCDEGQLLVPPGTKLNGTILFAQKAPNKYMQPRLVLDISNIVHADNQMTPVYARVIDVDNARETVRNNEIMGIVQPHASTKLSIAFMAVSAANPIAGYTVKGMQTVYGLSIRREILFPAGTDLQIQIVRSSMLKEPLPWAGWPRLQVDPELEQVVASAPIRTVATNNVPSDLVNLMFLGTRNELLMAFGEAGWIQAEDLGVGSALKAAQATMRETGYSAAPVSVLRLQGRPPDLVFQKSLDTFAKRHHIRIWDLHTTYKGREVWVGAATHDIATTNSRAKTRWSHRIDPHVDRERDWVESDLLFAGTATAYADIERPNAPKVTSNATGDDILTDGKVTVVELGLAGESKGTVNSPPKLKVRGKPPGAQK